MLYAASASNYGAVICLLPHDHSKRVTDAAEILDSQQVDYVHLLVDWLAPTQADVDEFTQALDRLMTQGLKVHVHCALNMRVSALCAIFLFKCDLVTHDQAQTLLDQVWGAPLEPA